MPADRPQVRRSERLSARLKTSHRPPMATQRPPRSRGKGTSTRGTKGQGRAAATASTAGASDPTTSDNVPSDAVVATSSGIKIRWDNNSNRTNTLVQFLTTHPGDCCVLFNEGGRKPDNEPPPSGSDKSKISAVIAHCVFEKDGEYENLYVEELGKFMQAVGNRLN
ncbi:hypothetical protein EDB19DRAFT_1691659 [Suillus lakei]|nr:hypothetical protein EDB19DRAFT_1691659 [Suillus lakei]